MVTKTDFKHLSNFKQIDQQTLDAFLSIATIEEKESGTVLTKQYFYSNRFYLLLNGEVSFSIQLEQTAEDFSVGNSNLNWTPIGWSGFRYPSRYATTVSCTKTCQVLTWDMKAIVEFLEINPAFGAKFFLFVSENGYSLLDSIRQNLVKNMRSNWSGIGELEIEGQLDNQTPPDIISVLQRSPFFEQFNGDQLTRFASIAKGKFYSRGESLEVNNQNEKGFYILGNGKVRFEYLTENNQKVPFKELNRTGLVVGWPGIIPNTSEKIEITVVRDSVIFFLPQTELEKYFKESAETAMRFAKRLLWLISNHLRSARSKLISIQFEQEILAVNNLFEQNATQLSVRSPLHRVSKLLTHTYTLGDAFAHLFNALVDGTELEKSLAQAALDILSEVYKEHKFYEGLTEVYDSVVKAPEYLDPLEIRKISARKFVQIYEKVPHIITGEEYLPETSNNIFILNHLKNHPYNTLPNDFQLTLDSHFTSSMILYRKYKDPGIRVVRLSTGAEYGHQDYYNRLGHIYVYTNESEAIEESKEEKKKRRDAFYADAANFIEGGTGLILSPEGTSFETHESPGQFKAGAFRLALHLDPEPYIVPIAVANFDKRISHNCLSVVIKKPFKISEQLKDPNDTQELFDWIASYHETYKGYVQEAIDQAENYYQ